MCSSPLDFRLGVLSVVGVESVSAALHQHGECDSEHLNATASPVCRTSLVVADIYFHVDIYCDAADPFMSLSQFVIVIAV